MMKRHRKRTACSVLCIAVALGGLLASLSTSDNLGANAIADKKDEYFDSNQCALCHRGGDKNDPEQRKILEFINFDEGNMWKAKDIHRIAFSVLDTETNELSRRMGKLLDIEDVSKSPKCLGCHALDLAPVAYHNIDDRSYKEEEYQTKLGVSCEACHGLAKKWEPLHRNREWRDKNPKAKQEVGQCDLRDPKTRAEVCVSCHVGDWQKGRIVTHEMYAAGHPMLPPIEIATFARDEPAHYKAPRDIPYLISLAKTDPKKSWELFHFRLQERTDVRNLVFGALETLRANARLLVEEATNSKDTHYSLDWANYDCFGCHHDLRVPSWRQARGYRGTPGRPQLRNWSVPLVRVIAKHADSMESVDQPKIAEGFEQTLTKLVEACNKRPFGVPTELAKAATDLESWITKAERRIDTIVYTELVSRKLLVEIAAQLDAKQNERRETALLDVDATQHLVWAAQIIRGELEADGTKLEKPFEKIDSVLPLHIRPQAEWTTAPLRGKLDARMKKLYSFEPNQLRDPFRELRALLTMPTTP